MKNNLNYPDVVADEINIKEFNLNLYDDKTNTEIFYNFEQEDNVLINSYGFSDLSLPVANNSETEREIFITSQSNICNLWQYRFYDTENGVDVHKIIWNNGNNYFEYLNVFAYGDLTFEINNITELPSDVVGINYHYNNEDFMLFSVAGSNYKLANLVLTNHASTLPQFLDICYAYDKIFTIFKGEKSKVYYSTTLNPFEFTQSDYIITVGERGKANKLMYFDDYLYIFRDYGITKISRFSSSSSFSIYDLYLTSNLIYEKTVVKCGDKILFLEQNGLKIFNGDTTKNIELGIEKYLKNVNNKNAVACFNNGNYFLALKLDFGSYEVGCENYVNGFANNVLISYNLNSGELKILRGVDIYSLISVNTGSLSTVLASFNGEYSKKIGKLNNTGKIFGGDLEKVWYSKIEDFDCPEKLKVANKIFIDSTCDCSINIKTDLDEQVYNFIGSTKIQSKKIKIKGHYFRLKITSNNIGKIKPPKINILKIK